jgi:hypothetical protein
MKLKELIEYAQSKYNVTIPMPEGAGDEEWCELEVENPHHYIRHPREFIVLGNFSYRLKSGEQNYRLPRFFLPEERANKLFNFGDRRNDGQETL